MVGSTFLFQKLTVFNWTTCSKHVNLNLFLQTYKEMSIALSDLLHLLTENRHAADVGGGGFKNKDQIELSRIL